MDIEPLNEQENRFSFIVKGISLPVANAIRRYSINRVPVLAIDRIIMYENSSSVFDEYIAHRIGLLPIKTPDGLLPSSEVSFVLDMQGPATIYSGDLRSEDAAIEIAEPKIPIITLIDNQSLRLEGKAVLGIGRKHAKFQAGIVAYEEKDDGTFVFKAESFMQMSAREMLIRGCKALESDLEAFSNVVSAIGGKKKKAKRREEPADKLAEEKKPRAKKAKKEEKTDE